MYESPVKISYDDINAKMVQAADGQILATIQQLVSVDKDELIRALQYDRGQYEKGYEDGKMDAVKHAYNKCGEYSTLFECSACGEECNDTVPWDHPEIEYCPHCGAKIIGEMEYKMLYHSAFPDGKESE